MVTSPLILLTSKSSIETDWQCGMKYWWHKLEGGNGIVPVHEADYFLEGRLLHSDLEPYAKGSSIRETLDSLPRIDSMATDQIALEKLSRRIGWTVAFGEWIEPLLRADHEEVTCEEEMVLERDPLWISFRPDRLQRSLSTKRLRYREWKSTSTTRQEWVASWTYSPQLHLSLKGIEEELKEKIDYANVLGFYKGQERDGKLLHPYTYAYRSPLGVWSPDYTYGWEKVGVWEYPEGVEAWVRKCGEDVSRKVFLWSAPVFCDERIVNSLVRARTARMKEIEVYRDICQGDREEREVRFEQRFNECRPAFGAPCQFLAACHNGRVNQDPVGSGIYTLREERGDE